MITSNPNFEDSVGANPVKEDLVVSPTPSADGLVIAKESYVSIPQSPQSTLGSDCLGNVIDDTPMPDGGYKTSTLQFPDPSLLVCFFDKDVQEGIVTLHPWQDEDMRAFGAAAPSSQNPYKYCLIGSNGSGKDKFIIAPFAVWFCFTKIRSRAIITTSSGTQLTSQTEPYIKDLCEKINAYFGVPVFRIRQRYIKCIWTGSEIRMFATDEAGKAEGYHPIDAKSEMAIIVNEGKSVEEDIHRALRRCTGFNYWIEASSCGEPKGYFYSAATDSKLKFHVRTVTSYDCPHVSKDEIEQDKALDGEHSAFFRSKHLSQFTSIAGNSVIPIELVNDLLTSPPTFSIAGWPKRIGIDLAAGGDENAICIIQGNTVIKEWQFRERDTVIASARIDQWLKDNQIPKDHPHIYADDGGISKGINDNLVTTYGWNISRVMNQWGALGNKKQFGNRGAENWYRCKRIIEEKQFDIRALSEKTREQLYNRYYKQTLTGGRIFLEAKSEAKAHGRPSPDRADAFILALTGLTVEDFVNASGKSIKPKEKKVATAFHSNQEVIEHYENEVTFGKWKKETITKLGRRPRLTMRQLVNH